MGRACAVCGTDTTALIGMPGLPLTGQFVESEQEVCVTQGHDLQWQFCAECGHGQLAEPLSPAVLYGEQYRFRTAGSATARKGARGFRDWVLTAFPGRRFETVVEFGCNDASLLAMFAGHAGLRIGIDPVLAHLVDVPPDGVQLISDLIENVHLSDLGGDGPDLVMCQHTLEHIVDPAALIADLVRQTRPGTLFAFELPCLDALLLHGRYDQIFHEHVHYFSVNSLARMLERLGLEVVNFSFDFNHWGAVRVAFRTGIGGCRELAQSFPFVDERRVLSGWRAFLRQAEAIGEILSMQGNGGRVGYGAAMMLPVLDHHFRFSAAGLSTVVDDHPARQGLWYRNLPVSVVSAAAIDFPKTTVILTAPDNRRPILKRLIDLEPARIVSPLLLM